MNRSRTPSPLPTMKTKLHTLLLVATAFGTHAVAQDTPPPSPPQGLPPGAPGEPPRRPDSPPRPDGDRPRPEAGRRPDGDRPRMEERRRPEGDRAPGSEPRRNPGEDSRREGEPRGEGGPSWFSPPPAAQRLRPYLGVVTSPAPAAVAAQAGLAEGFGLVVDEVLPDSPAKAAGLERYDVLARFEDQKLVDSAQLAALVGAASKDASISLTLIRKGQEQKLSVKVGEKMLPDRPAGAAPQFPQIRELWNRYGDAARRSIEPGGEFAERAQEAGRKAQEISREFQRRMQEFQEKVEQWRKNPNEKFPETPKFPNLSPQPQPGLPGEMLREVRPGGAPAVQRSEPGATTTWSTANAHVSIKDEAGDIEVRSENGRRLVIAKDKSGAVIFNGPIDTEEQRRQLPEGLRRKLDRIEVQTRGEHREPPREATAPRPAGGDVQ